MAKIVYKPHCGVCGAEINEKIQYMNVIVEPKSITDLAQQSIEVFPSRCEHCNQPFDNIEIPMPEQLPTERIK